MVADNFEKNDIIAEFKKAFKVFSMQYRGLWSNGVELKEMISFWVSALQEANMPPDDIEKTAQQICNTKEFKKYPPNPREFIDFWLSRKSNQASSLKKAILEGLQKISSTYMKSAIYEEERVEDWNETLMAEDISPEIFKESLNNLLKTSEHLKFPPSMPEILYECYRISVDKDLPDIGTAFEVAYSGKYKNNYIITETKRRCGFNNLPNLYGRQARDHFNNNYLNVIREAYFGDFKKTVAPIVHEEEKTSAADTIEKILESWKKN